MIETLRGRLADKQPTRLVIDVGGVGFGIEVSLRTSERLGALGETVELLTHLHVREEALDLYGFHDAAEKTLFLKLIGVSGIGPRLALRILSSITPQKLVEAIRKSDVSGLTSLKGVGKKTAEVIIASLRASLAKFDLPFDTEAAPESAAAGAVVHDAVRALVALGIKEIQAQEAVQKALQKLGPDAETGRLIAQALQAV